MKKLVGWMVGIAAVLLLFIVLAALALRPVVDRRQDAFGPLSEEVRRALMHGTDIEMGGSAPMSGEGGGTFVPARNSVPATALDSQVDAKGRPAGLSRLSRTLTKAELFRDYRPGNNPAENLFRELVFRGNKVREAIRSGSESDEDGGLALEIGGSALSRGDVEEARNYMRAALEISVRNGSFNRRNDICGQLAWIEDDPEVAASLLDASCTASRPEQENVPLPLFIQNALYLCIMTGSDDLAEHYYARWAALEPEGKQFVDFLIPRSGSDEIEAWLRQRDPDFHENATRWDPMEPLSTAEGQLAP